VMVSAASARTNAPNQQAGSQLSTGSSAEAEPARYEFTTVLEN
jgi:hypothetical protein